MNPLQKPAVFAREWIAAWNSRELDRIVAHYSDDVELVSPFVARLGGGEEGRLRGREALRAYFQRGLEAFPELCFELIRVYAGQRSLVLEYFSVRGLRAAETMEFDAAGRVRRVLAHYASETQAMPLSPQA